MRSQTRGCVTCAKWSRETLTQMPSHTFSKQNYPKYISDVLLKILRKKTQLLDLLSEFAFC